MATSPLPKGIDVSSHQGSVAWDAVKASGHAFAFAKATEGTFYRNPYFAGAWHGIKEAGLYRGSYHYARPSSSTPDAEAEYFLAEIERVGGLQTGDMLVLDLEDTNYHGGGPYGSAGKWALGFCQYIEAAYGFAPLIYWSTWYRPADIAATPELGAYPLWLAAYQQQMPPAPAPWEILSFWQFTSSGRVPGVNGDCDVNVFNGAADRIPLLGKTEDEPAPTPDTRIERALPLLKEAVAILEEPAPG